MSFKFSLQSVMQARQYNREVERLRVASARQAHLKTTEDRDKLAEARLAVISELRNLNDKDIWDVEKVAHRRRYAEELGRTLAAAEAAVTSTEQRLNAAIQSLIASNQSAQALERLAEKQFAEFQIRQNTCDEREFDDIMNLQRRVT